MRLSSSLPTTSPVDCDILREYEVNQIRFFLARQNFAAAVRQDLVDIPWGSRCPTAVTDMDRIVLGRDIDSCSYAVATSA